MKINWNLEQYLPYSEWILAQLIAKDIMDEIEREIASGVKSDA